METICPSICSISRPWSAKSPLPVDVRRSQRSLLIKLHIDSMGPSSAVGGKDEKKKSARIFRVDAEDWRRSRSQTLDTNVPIYSSKQSLRRGDVSLLRETDRSLVQIIWKPDERDYIREGLRDSKKKTCWPAPVSLLPVHNLSILIISPFFTINVRALMVACLFNCFKK